MLEVTGIDHIYITVSDLAVSERFYDRALVKALGFRKNAFALGGEPHIQYVCRHFGFVLRPARVTSKHEPYAPGLHHFCLRVDSAAEVEEAARNLLWVPEILALRIPEILAGLRKETGDEGREVRVV